MSKKDDFADLFSAYAPKKKDDSKLSLAERSTPSSAAGLNGKNNWANFDYLESSRSNSRASKPTPSTLPQTQTSNQGATLSGSNSGSDLFEGFDVINSGLQQQRQNNTPYQRTHSENLFEGFKSPTQPVANSSSRTQTQNEVDLLDSFGEDYSSTNVSSSSIPRVNNQQPQQHPQTNGAAAQSFDELFSVFDQPPPPKGTRIENPIPTHSGQQFDILHSNVASPNSIHEQATSRQSNQRSRKSTPDVSYEAKDEALASLVDMGFSVEQATEALNHTGNKTDVQGAVSYLMNKAHQEGRARSGLPPERLSRTSSSTSGRGSRNGYAMKNANQYFESFTKSMFKASDKLANEVANRFFSPPPNDGRPAWMRDQERHRRSSEFDEDPEELSSEAIERLNVQDQRFDDEDDNDDDLYERKPVPPPRRSAHPSRANFKRDSVSHPKATTPTQRRASNRFEEPQEEIDIFAPLPQSSKPQAPLTASQKLQNSTSSDMMTSSSRRRQTPRSKASTPSAPTRPNVSMSSIERETFNEYRERGGVAFKQGDFTTASDHYVKALNALPRGHVLSILAYSNCITASLKNGENKRVVEYADLALDVIGPTRGTSEEVEEGKNMKDFWIKITQKKAEALEHLEKFKQSLEAWNELIENGAANKVTLEGKRRCLDAINPKPKPKAASTARSPAPAPRRPQKSTAASTQSEGEALKRVRESNQASQTFEEDKFKLNDQIEAKVNSWKKGKEDNLRALLASLHEILWPAANWKRVNLSDLVMPKKVKITYMKAVAKVHPDKIAQNATSEQKLIAQNIFVVINTAWEKFKTANNIQ